MIFQHCRNINQYGSFCSLAKVDRVVKYTDTVLLPKTKFPHNLNAKQILERDEKILEEAAFAKLYQWQRINLRGQEFTLLDGPPYANGQVHIGHAINKVLKDIIIRAQLLQGRRVHFVPGWDCHGLPIELKAGGNTTPNPTLDAVAIRRRAREFARKTIDEQKSAFRSWGVMADWDNQVYHTYDPQYIVRQLQIFWELYNQGLLYRDLKPVYWSPSSRTALAEAELVYKDNHVSEAVTLRLRVVSGSSLSPSTLVYLLVWTTTPWTLPVNEAVCFSQDIQYSLVSIAGLEHLYIVGSNCIGHLQEKFKREFSVIKTLESNALRDLKYQHPWRGDQVRAVVPSAHVTSSGTGLVHVAPAHGHDDFLVGLRHGLPKISLIDGGGRYTAEAGETLAGLAAQDEGTQLVLKTLSSDIVQQERYTHNYPYDWRTDQPVLIRASQQWFIDTASIKESALKCLDSVEGSTDRLRNLLQSRPYWCISRQRAWGVPIPAHYHRTSGRPLVTKASVDALCRQISSGEVDAWWTLPSSKLFPPVACQELCVNLDDIDKGADIMDIWLDSGVAWSGLEGRLADVCLEGGDQHTGWFQSSLLTSVALRGVAPARRLLTHGFAVDENGRKMSKSLGNVVDPQTVVKTAGVDALRWWTASHAHHACVPASDRHLQSSRETVTRLRGILRFLLGALHDTTPNTLESPLHTTLDKYILDVSRTTCQSVMAAYNSYTWNLACTQIVNFAEGPISAVYVHTVKDRLYCDAADSPRRLSCLAALGGVLEALTICLAPVLPHLAEEVFLHHPVHTTRFWYRNIAWKPPQTWNNSEARLILPKALALKAQVDRLAGTTTTARLSCELALSEEDAKAFMNMQPDEESWDSELTELLQVASVKKVAADNTRVTLKETKRGKCPRCRRFTAATSKDLCVRCTQVLKSK